MRAFSSEAGEAGAAEAAGAGGAVLTAVLECTLLAAGLHALRIPSQTLRSDKIVTSSSCNAHAMFLHD